MINYLLQHALKIASAGVIVLTFLAYLTPYVNPALFRYLTFFGTAFPWFLLANIALLLVWGARLHRFALYHLGILIFGWQHVTAFIGLNVGQDKAPENAITVVTHNLGGIFRGIHLSDEEWSGIYTNYVRFLQDNGQPDVLCLQETGLKFAKSLAQKMGYPHLLDLDRGGTALLSRYPILRGGQVPFGQPENNSVWADLKIGARTVRVYNVHLQSNKVTGDTEKVMEDHDLQDRQTWREIRHVLRKVGGATSVRAGQAVKLRELVAASPYPVLLCGDFNDTPNSFVYDRLAEGLTDTFREKGFGFGTTFAGALPFLRIDYILADPTLVPYSCRVLRGSASDHHAVLARVGF
ncbi:MAG: endonuclease/exonuclease/phosphatase family protein [Saprospiraceae bacterium]|nr:endonuclease/exonuclease/phosphatase family protein [Saprospiraceae bacterium]